MATPGLVFRPNHGATSGSIDPEANMMALLVSGSWHTKAPSYRGKVQDRSLPLEVWSRKAEAVVGLIDVANMQGHRAGPPMFSRATQDIDSSRGGRTIDLFPASVIKQHFSSLQISASLTSHGARWI